MPDSKSRTEKLDDGTVAAWFTNENDEEQYLGAFSDERTADFAVGGALEAAEARAAAKPEPAPKATAKAEPAPAAKKS